MVRPGGAGARIIARAERVDTRRAAAVIAVSDDFVDRLIERGVGERLHVVPNFADVERISPRPRADSPFAREHGLDGMFTVTYAGNLGRSQDWDALIDAAADLADDPAVRFVLIGGGVEAERLKRLVQERAAVNVVMLPYQPTERIAEIYGGSDLCIVPMREHLDFDTLPSKIYSIMASARPALVYADPNSAVARLVQDVNCGIVVPRSDGRALALAIRNAMMDRAELARMGERGRHYVVQHHTSGLVARRYDELLRMAAP
jgi:colanic acid biosynthesis glycosyl transferase WcaI